MGTPSALGGDGARDSNTRRAPDRAGGRAWLDISQGTGGSPWSGSTDGSGLGWQHTSWLAGLVGVLAVAHQHGEVHVIVGQLCGRIMLGHSCKTGEQMTVHE